MTLKDLVEKYDGEIIFAVTRLVSGGVEDIVEFSNDDYKAIKDDIMASAVNKFSVTTSSASRTTTINVVLEEVTEAQVAEDVPVVDEAPTDEVK